MRCVSITEGYREYLNKQKNYQYSFTGQLNILNLFKYSERIYVLLFNILMEYWVRCFSSNAHLKKIEC